MLNKNKVYIKTYLLPISKPKAKNSKHAYFNIENSEHIIIVLNITCKAKRKHVFVCASNEYN